MEESGGLLDQISGWQLSRWIEFASLEPFGSEVDALRAGGIAAMIHNCAMGSRGGKGPSDFAIGVKRRPQSPADVAANVRAWGDAMAARAEKKDG